MILVKAENDDKSGRRFLFAVQAARSAEKENILQSLLFADILIFKRQVLPIIPSTNVFLEIYSKKEGTRGKLIAEKYLTFISIMQL